MISYMRRISVILHVERFRSITERYTGVRKEATDTDAVCFIAWGTIAPYMLKDRMS